MPGTAYGEGRDVLPGNAAYKVEVFRGGTWEEIFVYNARVSDYAGNPEAGYTQYTMGFALFTDSFRQPLKVRVTRRAGTPGTKLRSCRPLSCFAGNRSRE